MSEDHDQRFKTLLKQFFGEFFQLFFPEWAAKLDFTGVEWLDKEVFPDPPDGPRRMLDLLCKLPSTLAVRWGDQQATAWIVLVHIEIESAGSVTAIRRRMHEYFTDLRREHQLPVLPVVVFLRMGLDGIGRDAYVEAIEEVEFLRFTYLYVGLPGLDAIEYLQRADRPESALAAALAALMHCDRQRRLWLRAEALLRLAQAELPEQRKYLLSECVEAYLPLETPEEEAEYERMIGMQAYAEVRQMATTTFEKGLEQGIEKGLEQGLEQGIERARRADLLSLLRAKFGPLADEVSSRVAQWPAEDLSRLFQQALGADALQDLGLSEESV